MEGLKFRAWLKKEKQLVEVLVIDFNYKQIVYKTINPLGVIGWATCSFDDCIIESFTGLHGKNGKEIYEGDIVRIGQLAWLREIIWHNNSWKTRAIPEKCVQEYLNDHPKEKLECEKGYIEDICWIRDDETHYDLIDSEIIGNIHEEDK